MEPITKAVLIGVFGGLASFGLLIGGCFWDGTWTSFVTLLPYVFLPIPIVLAKMSNGEPAPHDPPGWSIISCFVQGFIVGAVFAIPVYLLVGQDIGMPAFAMTQVSTITALGSIGGVTWSLLE